MLLSVPAWCLSSLIAFGLLRLSDIANANIYDVVRCLCKFLMVLAARQRRRRRGSKGRGGREKEDKDRGRGGGKEGKDRG